MLVDQLRLAIATQENAEIVEPRDDALKLHPVDQKDSYGDLGLTDLIEKRILQVLTVVCHDEPPIFAVVLDGATVGTSLVRRSMDVDCGSFQPKNQVLGGGVGKLPIADLRDLQSAFFRPRSGEHGL